ncbi:hypothetical protein METBIDRAFT_119944 [Metschnikowia bicuspidata var. bicuspidata NRRL YB-4993]|uniref:Uncharacterized protein n=1 Tax=Metschnikowia bicuspidata var. bicuspidata NRRL YB-4993 TaxID=869754 RepID=A0A1A0HJL4_9ASCO|nr:hypothetical protein METBIDRAFT_119944 [Metschnikowia bicuspidata var. bicuspidata NRRL YB-4993]OBA24186.1 hypothetical protein METBIDRAFT_119944 [Metschnikowia bicuspidata var. bicuspidata NRRL YB-4993]
MSKRNSERGHRCLGVLRNCPLAVGPRHVTPWQGGARERLAVFFLFLRIGISLWTETNRDAPHRVGARPELSAVLYLETLARHYVPGICALMASFFFFVKISTLSPAT